MTCGHQTPLKQAPLNSSEDEQVTQATALPDEENLESWCYACGSSENTSHNPLVCVSDFEYEDGSEEYVHLACAYSSSRYGFCWCCESNHEPKVFMADALSDAGECADHAGESIPDYPEADRESYIAYIQKDE